MSFYDGRTTVRPYKSLHVMASISVVTRHGIHISRYTSWHPYQSLHVMVSIPIVTRRGDYTDRYTSLWHLAVVLVAIPACHIVFDVLRNVVSLSTIPNNAIIVPWLPSKLYLMLLCKR